MTLQIRFFGDPVLRKKCADVEKITPEIVELIQNMITTMDANKGIGLAASQVGVLLKIFVVRKEKKAEDGTVFLGDAHAYINPVLSNPSKQKNIVAEGCLSVPGLTVDVERPLAIDISYMDIEGKQRSERIEGFDARVLMHENDHLYGRLHFDLAPEEQKLRIKPLLKRLEKQYTGS